MHGEASFVMAYAPTSVLDAGCGTGRVAIELWQRGCEVVGVDSDSDMLAAAATKAPGLRWVLADLSTFTLGDGEPERFDAVVLAGNVMIFVAAGTERAIVGRLADHLADEGVLINGFQLRTGGYGVDDYDSDCAAVGLALAERYSTWDRQPWRGRGGYAVSVHRRVGMPASAESVV